MTLEVNKHMNNASRFKKVLAFEAVDRLPVMEWASWWDETILRWRQEGLPQSLKTNTDIMEYFGLDIHKQFWISAMGPSAPRPPAHGMGVLEEVCIDDYQKIKNSLYTMETFNPETIGMWAAKKAKGETAVWLTLDGFFWHPRKIMGIENHLYAFIDEPELMHMINTDLLEFNIMILDKFCQICVPDFITFAEDMSYNKGPMISKNLFDEFIAPYYSKIVPRLKEYGIEIIIDSDGNIHELIPWFENVGIQGFLPLERQAGVDINTLRKDHPKLQIIGGTLSPSYKALSVASSINVNSFFTFVILLPPSLSFNFSTVIFIG